MEYEKKQDKESSGIFTYATGRMELPITELEKGKEVSGLGAKLESGFRHGKSEMSARKSNTCNYHIA